MEPLRGPTRVTYEDYCSWGDDARWEIIDGEPYAMSPAPRTIHQRLVTRLSGVIAPCLGKSRCEAFVSPIDVKLSESDIVQPDVIVVCNPDQVTDRFIEGPPTLVVEVLSPSTLRHDRVRKLNLYARFGVPEFWLVTPEPAMVEVLKLGDDGSYRVAATHTDRDTLRSPTLTGVSFELSEVFGPPVDYPDEVRKGTPPTAAQPQPV